MTHAFTFFPHIFAKKREKEEEEVVFFRSWGEGHAKKDRGDIYQTNIIEND